MSMEIKRFTQGTPEEQAIQPAPTPDQQGKPQTFRKVLGLPVAAIGLVAAVVTTLIVYGLFMVYPWPHTSLDAFLALFARGNAAIWPMQIVWYAVAVAIVGLAMWPSRLSTRLISLLVAAYFVWIGIVFFAVLFSDLGLAGFWAAAFITEGILFLVAGVLRQDLVIAPRRWDLASTLGAIFIGYTLIGYPIIGVLGGHALSATPLIGLAPCATVMFALGLLLWARPPAPMYLLPLLLAWALAAAPPNLARGVVEDIGMLVAGVITAVVILWRDRKAAWQTLTAGALLTLMIAWSGHGDVLLAMALALVVVTLAQRIRAGARGGMPRALEAPSSAPSSAPSPAPSLGG